MAVSSKTKYTLTLCFHRHALCLPKWAENLCPHKSLHTDVYSWFIHNCQNLEATKLFLNRWLDKQNAVYSEINLTRSCGQFKYMTYSFSYITRGNILSMNWQLISLIQLLSQYTIICKSAIVFINKYTVCLYYDHINCNININCLYLFL